MRQREHSAKGSAPAPSVLPVSGSLLQRKCACGGSPGFDGECEECREKKMMPLQRRAADGAESNSVPPIVYDVLRSPGQPLDAATRSFMELRLGHDFSQVRVHEDAKAAESAQAVNALAYTVGRSIVFGEGQYAPRVPSGTHLLAHELVHVMQQTHLFGSAEGAMTVGKADDAAEREAIYIADRVQSFQPEARPRTNEPGYRNARNETPVNAVGSVPRPLPVRPLPVGREQSQALRRAVSVPENAAELKITAEPTTGLEVKNLLGKWRALPQTPKKIEFTGSAKASCGPGESARGYEIGIVQVQTREVNNGLYQGATPADGSVRIRLDIPAVRPLGPCIDSPYGKFWSDSKAAVCGSAVPLTHWDSPREGYDTIIENPLTKKPNYLRQVHVAFEFTTALMLKRPDASLQTLRWARWNVRWDYSFDTPASGESKIKPGSIAMTGTVQFYAPMPTPPELPTRYAVPAKNCTTLGYEAGGNPARIQASAS